MASRLAALLVLLALLPACTAEHRPPTTTPPQVSPTTVPPAGEDGGEARVFDLLQLSNHPNGAQLRIDRVEVLGASTVVSGHLINGSPFEVQVGSGVTELRPVSGSVIRLLEPLPSLEIPPAGEVPLTLRFAGVPEEEQVTLVLNEGGGASSSDPTTSRPSFRIGPFQLDAARRRPPLPDPVPVALALADPRGIELRIEGINFTETRIGLLVEISNPTSFAVRISPTIGPSLLVDDLGNRYPIVLPPDQAYLTVEPQAAGRGTLVFAGRIHPSARTVGLGINLGSSGSMDADRVFPEWVERDIPLSGEAVVAPLPNPLAIAETVEHPAGVGVELQQLSFTETGVEVGVLLRNGRSDEVALASAPSFLHDDASRRHPLVPLPGNPALRVGPNTTLEATLVFSGRVANEAGTLGLVFNSGHSADNPDTREPSFAFGPYPLQRPDQPLRALTAEVFPVGSRSRLAPVALQTSEVEQISQTLQEFGAMKVEGGFSLTLPDSILFDFGSAELRPDSSAALTLIAEVLEYYDEAEVVVVGHTDSVGGAAANQRLSEQRAGSVVEALTRDHAIAPERLRAEGRGAAEPVAPNKHPDGTDNPEGRQLNRRVEVIVLTDQPLPTG